MRGGWPLVLGGLILAGQGLWLVVGSGPTTPGGDAGPEQLAGIAALLLGLPPVVAGMIALRGARWGLALGASTGWLYGGFLAWQVVSAQGQGGFGPAVVMEASAIGAAFVIAAALLTGGLVGSTRTPVATSRRFAPSAVSARDAGAPPPS
jgi:hypothetical protein